MEKQKVLQIHSKCLFVALGIHHAMRIRHIVMWPLPLYNIFPYLPHKRHNFRKQVTQQEMCVLIFSKTLV